MCPVRRGGRERGVPGAEFSLSPRNVGPFYSELRQELRFATRQDLNLRSPLIDQRPRLLLHADGSRPWQLFDAARAQEHARRVVPT
jgi:hypothetical protein